MTELFGRDRVHWLVVAALVAAINGQAIGLFGSLQTGGLWAALLTTGGINPIFLFAMIAAAAIAFTPAGEAPVGRLDALVVAVVFGLALMPVTSVGSAGVLLAGTWLIWRGAPGSRERRAGLVVLALTASLLWGHLALALFGEQLVAMDGGFIAWLAGTEARGNVVEFVSGSTPMMISYSCSSLNNLTMAVQFWVAVTQLLGIPFGLRSALVGVAAVVANVFVNGLRLSTLVHNPADFDYWHVGNGGRLFAWLAVIAVAGVVLMGCRAIAPRRI